jgi:hypothetical protein
LDAVQNSRKLRKTIAGRDGNESSTRSVASTAATVVYRAIEPNSSTTRWTLCGRCEKRQGRVASTGVPSVAALKTACCGCGQLRLMASKSCRR